jgi:tetratricopeptide (TPR) repeat protein
MAPLVSESQGDAEDRLAYLCTQLERYQQNESHLSPRDQLAYGELLEEVARSYKDIRPRTEALVYLRRALDLYRTLPERRREAAVLEAMGDIYLFAGLQSQAAESLEAALRIYREIGDCFGEANTLLKLGDVKRMLNEYAAAEQLYQQALPFYCKVGSRFGEADALLKLRDVKRMLNEYAAAETLYRTALDIFSAIGDKYNQEITLHALAEIYHSSNNSPPPVIVTMTPLGYRAPRSKGTWYFPKVYGIIATAVQCLSLCFHSLPYLHV